MGIQRSRWEQYIRRDASQKGGRTWQGTEEDELGEYRSEWEGPLLDDSQKWKCRKKKGKWRKMKRSFFQLHILCHMKRLILPSIAFTIYNHRVNIIHCVKPNVTLISKDEFVLPFYASAVQCSHPVIIDL